MGPRPQRLPLLEARLFAQRRAPQAAATDGEDIWAVAAPSYGAFTVACNATPWNCRFPSVTDLVLSPDGKHAAALGSQNNSRFQIAVDGKVWDDAFDMAWPVVFRPPGTAPPPRSAAAASSPCTSTATP